MKDLQNCTGTEELNGEGLAFYRLSKPGGKKHFAIQMNSGQLSERRIFLRKALAPYPRWENLSNEQLDEIRFYSISGGYIVEDEKGCEFFLAKKGITGKESEFRRIRAMIPFEFIGLTGKDFDWKKYRADVTAAKDMVNRYIMHYLKFKEKGMGLYIHSGTKGSGKTMLACCIIGEITKRFSGSVKFINVLDFLEMTKRSYDGSSEIDSIYRAGLLVLDDIGVQMAKEWVDTVLYRLINERYANCMPTIYTSNIAIERLKMDDRIIDRIECTAYSVELPEESIRKETRQQDKKKLFDEITK